MTDMTETNDSMTAQQVFDTAVNGLRAQGRPAVARSENGYDRCMYRAIADGGAVLRCAAGMLIRDDEYEPSMEGNTFAMLASQGRIPDRLEPHVQLIRALQNAHDMTVTGGPDSTNIEHNFRAVAEDFGLVYTPPGLTAQSIFDTVLTALRKQGIRARDPQSGSCAYRVTASDGTILKCAVGHLLEDSEVMPKMNNKGVDTVAYNHLLPSRLRPFLVLLSDLQSVHDAGSPYNNVLGDEWEECMAHVAQRHGLVYTPLVAAPLPDFPPVPTSDL